MNTRTKKVVIISALAGGVLAAGGATAAVAADRGTEPAPKDVRLTAAQAAQTALRAAPGHVAELELDDGVWEVTVVGADGAWRELEIAGDSGKVARNAVDQDDDDRATRDAEAKALRASKVTAEAAAATALRTAQGTVTGAEFTGTGWEVEVTDAKGAERDLTFDGNGQVTANAPDTDDDADDD
ncbi:PepSY domain-containing protein [Actinomadura flavalba]|uniref:PepSY domain-containing protein n=1 Tax=Actinomadura flavalba TaxID=1120938 RepID=UPI00037C2C52|nr:PepSY domain-containing protein [Actinomadura flavalba]